MARNQSIRSFFSPAQSASNVPKSDATPSTNSSGTQLGSSTKQQSNTSSTATKMDGAVPLSSGSSLSAPPSSEPSSSPAVRRDAPPLGKSTGGPAKVEIKSSDDEDSDSDASLPELGAFFRGQDEMTQRGTNKAPSTPRTNRLAFNMHLSPIPILSKQKFGLKQLLKESEKDDATEASSKRIKTLDEDARSGSKAKVDSGKHSLNEALLESVVSGREEGTMQKVTRALKRTEATNVENRWYFFDTESVPKASSKQPFPSRSATGSWQQAFSKPETFTSGLAENMVTSMVAFGKNLPGELFQWILDEACFEPDDVLRHSYFNTIGESGEQLTRLLSPTLIEKLFRNLGASSEATNLSEKIVPIPKIETPYSEYNWALLRSLLRFLSRSASWLRQEARTYAMCLLLRMTIDEIVPKYVDILVLLQGAIRDVCKHVPEQDWDSFCQTICTSLFESVKLASLRIHIILTIPSTTPRSHELRRRLAISFFFDDLSRSTPPPFTTPPLETFITRLLDRPFRIGPRTDYAELTALVGLLDVAIDDARFTDLDLTEKAVAESFDAEVDELVVTIKELTGDVGNPGASYISKIEAKEVMELVSQRLDQTLRTKPKARLTHFDKLMKEENLDRERARMNAFLKPKKPVSSAEEPT
ncbi:hypothetical protein BJ875DRAFT_396033 [Amylocarpus encephaloides]|uniref:Uncharacterized protein n=1 Tax=Amylocarpus encephaloides TaxID=45428 RepID=A0A9P7YNK4_9HELO|nr:hypothetical protein BJ875DRAFT_396033 [Amylocarpus encephaloides]